MTASWRGTVEAYWSEHLGVPLATLAPGEVRVVRHGKALESYRGVFAFELLGVAAVVSAPDEESKASLGEVSLERALDPATLTARLGDAVERVVGPAFIGYAGKAPPVAAGARLLLASDAAAVSALERDCDPTEWEHGGGAMTALPAAGSWDGARLGALATCEIWGGTIAHISVIADPALRGRGHARAAVGLLAVRLLELGLVPQYRTLESNVPSMRVAGDLGFVRYARSLAVRLR